MPKVQFEEMFPWEIAHAVAQYPICYLPLGVLEWHGEHNAVGLDAFKAHAVCIAAAQLSGGVVVPPLYWGSDGREDLDGDTYLTGGAELGERYHLPGNMFWIRPETFHNLLLDIYEAMRRRGFRVIIVLSGHWSPQVFLPTVRSTAKDFAQDHPEVRLLVLTDRDMVPDLHYPPEHGAGGETSFLMAVRPDLVDLSKTLETDKALAPYYAGEPEHLKRRATTPHKYIGINPAVADDSNDPELTSSATRGEQLFRVVSQRVAKRATALLQEIVFAQ